MNSVEEAWLAVLGRSPSSQERATVEIFLNKRAGTATQLARQDPGSREYTGGFQENTPQERLLIKLGDREGDEFTVEAVVSLDSIDANAAVRTIASRWNGGKDSQEAFGWSLGVTGEKSRFKPRNLILQVVGEDENANIGYQVVPSNLRIELGRRYHLAARVSCTGHNVTFTAKDLETVGALPQSAVIPMEIRSKLSKGTSQLFLGGLNSRAAAHQWNGRIEALRIATGTLPDASLNSDPKRWSEGLVVWRSSEPLTSQFAWSGSDAKAVEPGDPSRQAMNDLCQVLLNANEFFYLH